MQSEIIQKLIAHIEYECSAVDVEKLFDEMLDECFSFDGVGGPFEYMVPSSVLKEMDPTAYRCGVNDYVDGLCKDDTLAEINDTYYYLKDAEKARDEFVEELQDQLREATREADEMKEDEDHGVQELASLHQRMLDLERDIEEVEKYGF